MEERRKIEKEQKFKTRRKYTPTPGEIYRNEGGGTYLCLSISSAIPHEAVMQNTQSGWTFTACGIGIYDDGSIDWDYSKKDGYFDLSRQE